MDLALMIPIMGILLTMIPVAGLTLVLVLRLAVKPLVETLADAVRESRVDTDAVRVGGQLQALIDEVETLTHEVRELKSANDFDRKLLSEREGSSEGV